MLKMLPVKPDNILVAQLIRNITALGTIHMAKSPVLRLIGEGNDIMKSMKHKLMILVVMALFITACKPAATTFRPPDPNEMNAFIKDQGISPVTDKLLDDSVVLLYEKGTSFGYYTLSVQEPEGKLTVNNASAVKSDQPILILGQTSGDLPFLTVMIQDAALLAETTAIEVGIDSQNRLTATTNGRAGAILVSHSPVNDWGPVTLYNAQGEILYRHGDPPVQKLRVVNNGREDIHSLSVLFPGATANAKAAHVEFGDLPAGETSEYRDIPSGVYRYAAYEYTLDGRKVEQAVKDWVGESPMKGEKFTYRIQLDPQKAPGGQVELIEVLVDQP